MGSLSPDQGKDAQTSSLVRQIAIGLTVVSILICTILGSAALTRREGLQRTVGEPTATHTTQPFITSTQTPSPVPPATSVPTVVVTEPALTPSPSPEATALPQASETPTTSPPTKVILATATPTVCYPPASWRPYVVQSGDTLTSLAQRFGTSVERIIQANCLSGTTIYEGTKLYLPPPPAPPTPVPTLCTPNPPPGWVLYTVQRGDTLYGLALRHGTTAAQAKQVNCLASETVYAGQQIYLPLLEPSVTPTWTLGPTSTATLGPTSTSTVEVTETATVAQTSTAAPSMTPTPTTVMLTPTATASPTPTNTPTATLTPLPTPTETDTPTPSPTPIS